MHKTTSEIHRALMKRENIGENELARKTKVSQPTIHRILSGESEQPRKSTLQPLAKYFAIPVEVLLTGTGPKEIMESMGFYVLKIDDASHFHTSGSNPFAEIPLLELFCSAGNGEKETEDPPNFLKHLSFRRDWLEHEGLDPAELTVCLVNGESMQPTLNEDDVILVNKRYNTLKDVKNGKVYALTVDGIPMVKRLYKQELGDLDLSSDNPNFRTQTVLKSEMEYVEIIGRVVWAGGKVR